MKISSANFPTSASNRVIIIRRHKTPEHV
jgi:hypothetical protein